MNIPDDPFVLLSTASARGEEKRCSKPVRYAQRCHPAGQLRAELAARIAYCGPAAGDFTQYRQCRAGAASDGRLPAPRSPRLARGAIAADGGR